MMLIRSSIPIFAFETTLARWSLAATGSCVDDERSVLRSRWRMSVGKRRS
jgi:hypothetical protein